MCLGAVFMAANASSVYRVKKLYLQEGFPFGFDVYIKSGDTKIISNPLFEKR